MKPLKQLKASTIKRYSVRQLANHLDNLQNHFWELEKSLGLYLVNLPMMEINTVESDAYYFHCKIAEWNRDTIISAIETSYREIKRLQETHSTK